MERITKCNEEIEKLQGKNQALAFISPSKFIRTYKFEPENNVSMFHEYLQRPCLKRFDPNTKYDMEHQIEKVGKESMISLNQLN